MMPDNNVATIILLVSFVILLILKTPITFSLIISSVLTALYLEVPLMSIVQRIAMGVHSFSLLAIPFFIVAGEIMGAGGISRRLIAFSNVLVGHVRGGLALVNVLASMFFGGISGSAVADVSSIGAILIPMMKKKGYHTDYAVSVTVTSACQGVLIPPSHNMIIFAMAAGGVSVGKLFLGGLIPGVLLGVALMILSYVIAIKRGYPKEDLPTFKESVKIAREAILGLITIVIIVGGVIFGIFTATESAVIACIYAFIVTFFIYREISIKKMKDILLNSLRTLAMVMSLLAAANAFAWLLSYLSIPMRLTEFLLNLTDNKIVLLLVINVMLLVLGCIMDMAPLIVITTPILYPVVVGSLGMDPVQFGVMLILNLAIGLCTPPVGSALFVGCAIGEINIEKQSRSLLPFYAIMVIVLLMITFIPGISTFIPNLIVK